MCIRDRAKAGGTRKQAVKKKNKRQKIAALIQAANLNQEKYSKRSKEEIRKIFYNEGVNVEYTTRKPVSYTHLHRINVSRP